MRCSGSKAVDQLGCRQSTEPASAVRRGRSCRGRGGGRAPRARCDSSDRLPRGRRSGHVPGRGPPARGPSCRPRLPGKAPSRWGLHGWAPERFPEDVDLAFLAGGGGGGGVGDDQPSGQRIGFRPPHLSAALFQPGAHGGSGLLQHSGFSVATWRPLPSRSTSPVRLDGVATREHERVDVAHGEDIREEPPVQFREIHAAAWASGLSSSKAFSHTSRMSRDGVPSSGVAAISA